MIIISAITVVLMGFCFPIVWISFNVLLITASDFLSCKRSNTYWFQDFQFCPLCQSLHICMNWTVICLNSNVPGSILSVTMFYFKYSRPRVHRKVCLFITRMVVRKELLQEMGEFDWLRKHVLQIDNAR